METSRRPHRLSFAKLAHANSTALWLISPCARRDELLCWQFIQFLWLEYWRPISSFQFFFFEELVNFYYAHHRLGLQLLLLDYMCDGVVLQLFLFHGYTTDFASHKVFRATLHLLLLLFTAATLQVLFHIF